MSAPRRTCTPPVRAGAVQLTLVAATAVALRATVSAVAAALDAGRAVTFEQLLVAGCAVAASAGILALLTTATVVLTDLCNGRVRHRVGPLRGLVLAMCGIAAVTTTPAAHAAPADIPRPPSVLTGLPLPDRASGGAAAPRATVAVGPGDSLWSIARTRLGPGATDAEVATYVRRLHAGNVAVIGRDPDLIRPGQRLQLPPTRPLDR